ncbi:MAG: DUF421 domain-containing protein [Actinomycetota bacterium]|nr:DUF421 domain-containing protein [Actinomycetota bacterium]
MPWLTEIKWESVFVPETALLELVLRGTLTYLALFFLLRFVLKRESGELAVTDLLLVVLIADAAQNAMADEYRSVPEGIVLVTAIVTWAVALNWLGHRYPWIQRVVKPPKLPLIQDGQLVLENMRRELVTRDELLSQLRLQGIENISDVRAAYMEPNGQVSVLPFEKKS